METKENLKERLKHQVMERMDISRTMEDEEILELVQKTLEEDSHRMPMSISMRQNLIREIFHSLRRLDILQELIEDADITEIMVNGTKGIFYEKAGRLYQWDKHFTSEEKLQDVIQQIAGGSNRMVNELHPIVDTRLPDGSRVNIVLKPIAIDGTALSIRRFPKEPVRMQTLIEWGSISMEVADFLKHLVCAGYNIFVSGGTGSGKTTFLNALSEFIPKEERVVTIEDSAELQLLGLPNLVRLESRDIKLPGAEEITIRDLIKSALRMRPNRIIVGECRGAEALDVLQAMNTGHSGSLSTGHANSAMDMVSRLETMVLMGMDMPLAAIQSQIASAIDIIIQLGRIRDGSRKLLQVVEVKGVKMARYVYTSSSGSRRKKNREASAESGRRKENFSIRKNYRLPDYRKYHFRKKQFLLYVGEFLLLDILIGWLFYQSTLAILTGFGLCPVFLRNKRNSAKIQRQNDLKLQFKDALLSAAGAMRAGYSIENAWREAKKDVIQQYGMESDMAVEMRQMIHQMDCNVPLEQLLEDFAERSRIEDVEQFAGIFSYAKRSGGDFTAIMGNTVRQMADRMELQETIETALTARKMEQKVMNVIPLFILAFVNVTSGSFLEALYGNVAGVLIMTGCLILYGLAYLWSEKIVRRIGESIC